MALSRENIVSAVNQNEQDVYFYGSRGLRVLFIGNSVTLHGIKLDIGWDHVSGMAASCLEKDYVHLLTERIRQYDPNATFAIAQAANLERMFMEGGDYLASYQAVRDFHPDIITTFYGANVPHDYEDKPGSSRVPFGQAYRELLELADPAGKAAVFHAGGFFPRPVLNSEKQAVAVLRGEPYISFDGMFEDDRYIGMHAHPNDCGMQRIADGFWEAMEPTVKRLTQK